MNLICPLCNGLIEYQSKCPSCGDDMVDEGPVVDYLDDYSPYLASDITQKVDGVPHDKCAHLYQCISCERDRRISIRRIRE